MERKNPSRVLGNNSNNYQQQQSPLTTPTRSSRLNQQSPTKQHQTSASPQVKAALAALRKNRSPAPKTPSFPSIHPPSSSNNLNDQLLLHVDGVPSLRTSSSSASALNTVEEGSDGVLIDWGVKSIRQVLNGAKRTGRFNVASRGLTSVPTEIFAELMPISSAYHPTNQTSFSPPSTSPSSTIINLSIASPSEPDAQADWYTQVDLKQLVLSSNEIHVLPSEIAGFDELELLDLHNNLLISLPPSIAFIASLTTLNLSSNSIEEFPFQILALDKLKELNLSRNKLMGLWSKDWKQEKEDAVPQKKELSPSKTPESFRGNNNNDSFWDLFPSSPSISRNNSSNGRSTSSPESTRNQPPSSSSTTDIESTTRPFPSLIKLDISNNPFLPSAFTDSFVLPKKLTTLEMSNCPSIPPINTLSKTLPKLSSLDLSGCGQVSNDYFHLSTSEDDDETPIFPSLTSLDISRTSISSLENLERLLSNRPTSYTGLPKLISNIIARENVGSSGGGGMKVEVRVIETALGDEERMRRRDRLLGVVVEKKFVEKVEVEEDLLEEVKRKMENLSVGEDTVVEGEELCQEPIVVHYPPVPSHTTASPLPTTSASPSTTSPSVTLPPSSPSDPSLQLLLSSISPTNPTRLTLFSHSLTSLPIPSPSTPPISLTSIDLSKNKFSTFPLLQLHSWNSASTLRKLNLSGNKIGDLGFIKGVKLESLEDLDLSNNRLRSLTVEAESGKVLEGGVLFEELGMMVPNLKRLELSNNFLNSLHGVEKVLLTESESDGERGLVELRLGGNKIEDLDGLVKVAEWFGQSEKRDEKSWRCKVLDLQNNEIGRLPPSLGLLPHNTELLVQGNTFRIPRREVYMNGSRGLLEWLKDRC